MLSDEEPAVDKDETELDENKGANKPGDEEGDLPEGEESLEPPKKKLSRKMLMIIAAASAILLLGGGAALYFSGVFHSAPEQTPEEHLDASALSDKEVAEKKKEVDKSPPVFYSLGDILVNLSGDGKRPNFLKIKVVLELADEKDVAKIEALKPRIIDHFQVYLRELRIEDLRGSAGLYRLREELLLRVSEAVQPIRVRDILFQEMLVQ